MVSGDDLGRSLQRSVRPLLRLIQGGAVQPEHTLSEHIDCYLDHCALNDLSEASIDVYARNLRAWMHWRSEHGYSDAVAAVTIEELRTHFLYLKSAHVPHQDNPYRPAVVSQRGLAPASRNLRWRVLAGFWSFLEREGLLLPQQRDLFTRLPRPTIPKRSRQSVEVPTVRALLRACAGNPEEMWRDRAMILLLAQTGARISELCTLQEDRVNLAERSAVVWGKGGRTRTVFWAVSAAQALVFYLRHRRPSPDGWLFLGMSTRSKSHWTPGAVRDMLRAHAAAAEVQLPPGQPAHGFRRGFARQSIRRGMPGPALQQLLGHATADMTQLYAEEEDVTELGHIYRRYWDKE